MTFDRSAKIMNGLIAICIVAGFACFALIALPEQLKKAGISYPEERGHLPTKLSSIISLNTPYDNSSKIKMAEPQQAIVPISTSGEPSGNFPSSDDKTGNEAAGGAGAAMDDNLQESRVDVASNHVIPEGENSAADPNNETKIENPAENTSAPSAEVRSYPLSSITKKETSVLDDENALKKKSWLKIPKGLEADVAFWRDIYTKYDKNQKVLHNPKHLSIVYDVVDLTDIDRNVRLEDVEKARMKNNRVDERKKEIIDTLKKLTTDTLNSSLTADEWRIKKLFDGIKESSPFKNAIEDGVRSQTGQRDKFLAGLKYSGRYLGEIEAVFASYGLPRELTRLTFVESTFNPYAISSVGASGVWQFMPGTGKLYLQINDIVDERNDPVNESHAAAKLLRHDYEALGGWDLAINAYNTGRGRIEQAMSSLGTTDIGRIIKEFNHSAYGFASRNFFLEFLAAVDAAEHAEKYFGPVNFEAPLKYEVVKTGYNIALPEVARAANIDIDALAELNPMFTQKVISGSRLIPAGYYLRVPVGKSRAFLSAMEKAPSSNLAPIHHVVENGESIESVAKMYGVEPVDIVHSNKLVSRRLHTGQTVAIPVNK